MADRIQAYGESSQKKRSSRFTIHPGMITVHKGTIAFLDKATATAISVSDLTLSVRVKMSANNVRIVRAGRIGQDRCSNAT